MFYSIIWTATVDSEAVKKSQRVFGVSYAKYFHIRPTVLGPFKSANVRLQIKDDFRSHFISWIRGRC